MSANNRSELSSAPRNNGGSPSSRLQSPFGALKRNFQSRSLINSPHPLTRETTPQHINTQSLANVTTVVDNTPSFINNSDYQTTPTEFDVLPDNRGEEKTVDELRYLCNSHQKYTSLGIIAFCRNLRVCDLTGNFIKDCLPLQVCTKLVHLNLCSNRIERMPPVSFWVKLRELRILYLHDNCLAGDMNSIADLAHCSQLSGMFVNAIHIHI